MAERPLLAEAQRPLLAQCRPAEDPRRRSHLSGRARATFRLMGALRGAEFPRLLRVRGRIAPAEYVKPHHELRPMILPRRNVLLGACALAALSASAIPA